MRYAYGEFEGEEFPTPDSLFSYGTNDQRIHKSIRMISHDDHGSVIRNILAAGNNNFLKKN